MQKYCLVLFGRLNTEWKWKWIMNVYRQDCSKFEKFEKVACCCCWISISPWWTLELLAELIKTNSQIWKKKLLESDQITKYQNPNGSLRQIFPTFIVTEIGFFTRDFSYTCDTWDSLMYFWQKVTAMGKGATIIQTKSVLRKICQYKGEARQICWCDPGGGSGFSSDGFGFGFSSNCFFCSKQGNASMPPL